MGFGAIGAAIGEGYTAAQANEAISEKPDSSGDLIKTMLVGQAVAESASIFALVVAILLIFSDFPGAGIVKEGVADLNGTATPFLGARSLWPIKLGGYSS